MAQYRMQIEPIKRKEGRSTVAAAAYRAGVSLRDERLEMMFDYRARRGIESQGIMAPESTPARFLDRETLWNAVEAADVRHDARPGREILISLPFELNAEQRVALVRAFIAESLVERGMIADYGVHLPDAHGDQRNHHAHILITTRTVGPEGFGGKARDWDNPAATRALREEWADVQNRHLKLALGEGAPQVTARSLAEQGLDHEPTVHLGPSASGMERRGERSDRGDINRDVRGRNHERQEGPRSVREIEEAIARRQERRDYPIGAVAREFEAIHQTMVRERALWERERLGLKAPEIPSGRSIQEEVTAGAAQASARARAQLSRTEARVSGVRSRRSALERWIRNPGRMIWAKHTELNALSKARRDLAAADANLSVRRTWLKSPDGQAWIAARQHPYKLAAEEARRTGRTLERKIKRADRRIEAVALTRTKLLVAEQLGEKRIKAPGDLSLGPVQAIREVDRTVGEALKAYTAPQKKLALEKVLGAAMGRGMPGLDL